MEEPGVEHSYVVPSMWLLYFCQPALPLATQVDTLRQVRYVMSQRIVGIHLHGSVARQCQVEISRHCVSTWDWGAGNPKNYSTERLHIRILVTCGQVVNAYQNDREQDEDLTQKDYFHRTDAKEYCPLRSVRQYCPLLLLIRPLVPPLQ